MYICRLQESRGWSDNRKLKLCAAFESDRIIVFTVTTWSSWLNKGLLYLIGDATSKVHTVQGKSFVLSQGTLECALEVHIHDRDGPLMHHENLAGSRVEYKFSLEADFAPLCIECP